MSCPSWPIWIRDSELAENFAFNPFHLKRVLGPCVIVADQMQEAMHDKVGEMMSKRLSFQTGFAGNGLKGKNDVAEMVGGGILRRKCQHVRGLIDAPPIPVKCANCRIIGQNDSKLGAPC